MKVAEALDAEEARTPLGEELAREAEQPLELKAPIQRLQPAPGDPACRRPALALAKQVGEHAEVERDLRHSVSARPGDRLDDEEFHQAVRSLTAAPHGAQRVAARGRRRDEMEKAADLPACVPGDDEKRAGMAEQHVHRHREAACGPASAPLVGDLPELLAQHGAGLPLLEDRHAVTLAAEPVDRLPHLANPPPFE